MTPPPVTPHASPTHQALAELLALLEALPAEKTVTVNLAPAGGSQQPLAAQLRAVIANQSQYQGGT